MNSCALHGRRRKLAEGVAVLSRETSKLCETGAERHSGNRRACSPPNEFLPRPGEPHSAHPSKWRSTQERLEMRLQGSWTNTGNLRKQVESTGSDRWSRSQPTARTRSAGNGAAAPVGS